MKVKTSYREFELLMMASGIPTFIKEYQFMPGRKFAFDYAWPALKVAVEIEGVMYGGNGMLRGGHVSPSGFVKDMEKYNYAACLGWKVLRVTPQKACSIGFIKLIKWGITGEFPNETELPIINETFQPHIKKKKTLSAKIYEKRLTKPSAPRRPSRRIPKRK